MTDWDEIATYYTNARELVKANQPRAARAYVVAILNAANKQYKTASTILSKAKTAAFLERWITVSRELYDNGITEYVKECFGLDVREHDKSVLLKADNTLRDSSRESSRYGESDALDISGIIAEAAQTQGWCAAVFEANRKSVVEIFVSSKTNSVSGTGFIISSNGYLLTNDHVVFDKTNGFYHAKAYMSFVGEKTKYKIEPLFSDEKSDVALCRFNPDDINGDIACVRRIVDYSTVKQGADCLVIGNAFGMGLAPFSGTIRYTQNSKGDMVYTAPSNPGDSGGPVFNRSGECIGINKSRTVSVGDKAADGYANATPMDTINRLLVKWMAGGGIEL